MTEVRWAEPADDAAVAGQLAATLSQPGPRSIAVPGGRTPAPILKRLAGLWRPEWRARVTLTDDRSVPDDHPASNFAMLREALGGTGAELARLEEGRAQRPFDLVWVGMGTDGHVASLFPGGTVADDAPPTVARTTPDPLPPEAPFSRLTLTMTALTATRELVIVARGEAKRRLLEQAMAGEGDLPVARLLAAAACPVTVYWSEA